MGVWVYRGKIVGRKGRCVMSADEWDKIIAGVCIFGLLLWFTYMLAEVVL
jgi:hypothetical protein